MKLDKALESQPLLIGGAVLGVVLLWMAGRAAKATAEAVSTAASATVDTAAGVLTGNNAITQNATNAAGDKTTAYEGAGVFGTLGAATNAMLGGAPASLGEWLGDKLFDWQYPSGTNTTNTK